MRVVRLIAVFLVLVCLPATAMSQTFPADGDWTPVRKGDMPIGDAEGDVTGSRDIVGDSADAAAFVYSDATFFYVRLRLDDDPTDNQGDLRPFSWGVEFETDGNFDDYEALVMVDGIANPAIVSLQENTNQGTVGDPSDAAEVEIATYPFGTHGRVMDAATTFGGDADYFLDFAAAWSDLELVGVTQAMQFRIILGSGNSANSFSADIGTSIADAVSDPVYCDSTGCSGPPVPIAITAPGDGVVTNDPTPTIEGSTEPGATVDVVIDAGTADEQTATVTAGAAGNFGHTVATALGEGAHTVDVTASVSSRTGSDSSSFEVDVTPPAIAITAPADGATLTARTPEIAGTAEAGVTIELVLNAGTASEQTATVQADAMGDWSHTPSNDLPTGANTVEASATDAAGNTASDSISFTVDIGVDVAINSPADGSATNDETPTVSGTGEPGGTVTVVIDAGTADEEMATVDVDGIGNWSYDVTTTLDEGEHTVDAMQTDSAGETTSDTVTFEVDTTPPTVRIQDPADMSTTSDPTPGVEGSSSVPGADIVIVIDPGTPEERTATVTADANGNWSYTPSDPLADGNHEVAVSTKDSAGNEGTDTVTFHIDSDLPFVVINQPTDQSVMSDTQPTISGRTDPDQDVEIAIDPDTPDERVVTVTAGGAGFWSHTPDAPLDEGEHTVRATVTSMDGGTSSDEVAFEVDTMSPETIIDAPSDGEVTNDPTPTVEGSTEPGATVVVTIGERTHTTTADENGAWSVEVEEELADGDYAVAAQATDEAGNQGDEVSATFTVDTAPPALDLLQPEEGAEISSTPTVSGTGEPGTTVEVFVDGTLVTTTTVGEDGNWSVGLGDAESLEPGERDIEAVATDAAGNQSSDSVSVTVVAMGGDDRDDDGLSNDREEMLGTDPDDPDTDADGLLDGEEIEDWSTDPLDPDSDDDGLDDGDEIDADTNPNRGDTDNDGLTDLEEINAGTDPRDFDTDDGGVWDGNEIERGTDPLDGSDDHDAGEFVSGAGCSSVDDAVPGAGWLFVLMAFFGFRRRPGRRV